MPPDYYDLPALKPSHWKWMVAFYILLARVAGALQILAALQLLIAFGPVLLQVVYDAVAALGLRMATFSAPLRSPTSTALSAQTPALPD